MKFTKSGGQTGAGPKEWFTGTVQIDGIHLQGFGEHFQFALGERRAPILILRQKQFGDFVLEQNIQLVPLDLIRGDDRDEIVDVAHARDERAERALSVEAQRAAATARLISSASPSATVASNSPVAGLCVSNFLPEAASIHFPSISIFL